MNIRGDFHRQGPRRRTPAMADCLRVRSIFLLCLAVAIGGSGFPCPAAAVGIGPPLAARADERGGAGESALPGEAAEIAAGRSPESATTPSSEQASTSDAVTPSAGKTHAEAPAATRAAYEEFLRFQESLPAAETAAAAEERRGRTRREAERLAGPLLGPGLAGEAAFHAGSLLLAAGRGAEALPLLERSVTSGSEPWADTARLARAAAHLELKEPEKAAEALKGVREVRAASGVTAGYAELALELAGAFEEAGRWDEALPWLEKVRDGGDPELGPLAARLIPYLLKDAGRPEQAEAEARKAIERFPGEKNMVSRLNNFLHQNRMIGQPFPALPEIAWIGPLAAPASLAELARGKVLLVDVWATWCGPCRRSFPFLAQLQEKYASRGLAIVGLTRLYGYYQDEKTMIKDVGAVEERTRDGEFAARFGLGWPVGVADDGIALFAALGVAGIPHFVLVDRQGTIRQTFMGESPLIQRRLESALAGLLEAAPPAP